MAKYRSEVHVYCTENRDRPDYVWDGKSFVMPANDNAKRFCYIGHAKKAALELNRAARSHPALERGKWKAEAIDIDAKPEPAAKPEPPAEVIERAFVITTLHNVENGESYEPSNGTEGEIFTANWCDKCDRDTNEDCSILAESYANLRPIEWQYWDGKPICTAWTKRNSKPQSEPQPSAPQPTVTTKQYAPANFELGEPANPLKPATTEHPWSTPANTYRGYRYWVAGDYGDGRNGCYWYFVTLTDESGEPIRTTQSDESFSSVVEANQAARAAINKLSSINLVEVSA